MTEELEKTEAMEETTATEQKVKGTKNLDPREALVDEIKLDWLISYPEFAQKLHAMVNDPVFIQLRRRQDEANVFNIVGQTQTENWHSSFFAWLLNPNGSHNLGYFPLKTLLMYMYQKANDTQRNLLPDPEVIDAGYFCDAVVRPESRGKIRLGEKSVSNKNYNTPGKEGKVRSEDSSYTCKFDIALSAKISIHDPSKQKQRARRFVFICENKVDSAEGKPEVIINGEKKNVSQTEIYADFWKDHNQAIFPLDSTEMFYTSAVTSHLAMLFLSANGKEAGDKNFINMNYDEFYKKILIPVLHHPDLSQSGKTLLKEYIDSLEQNGYIVSETTKKLLKEIFAHHHDIFELYLKYKFFFELPDGDINPGGDVRKIILAWLSQFTNARNFVVHQDSKNLTIITKSVKFATNPCVWEYDPKKANVLPYNISITTKHYDSYDQNKIDEVSVFWSDFYSPKIKESDSIRTYLDAIENRYGETLTLLMNNSTLMDDNVTNKEQMVDLAKALGKNQTDYQYLLNKLKFEAGEDYPRLYHKQDTEFKHPVFINLIENSKRPTFKFVPTSSGSDACECQCKNEDSEIEIFDWVSGNQICKDIAARLNQTAQSNNTWSYYLGIKNDKSKWASLPSSDKGRVKSGTKKAKK